MVSTPSEAAFATTSAWHDPTDVQVRKIMMARLRSHPALAQHHPILQAREDTGASPSLLQRLEWMLYHSAGSLSEYLHQPSLERRVQSLVTHYKRKRANTEPSDDIMANICAAAAKRRRPQLSISEEEIRNCSVGAKGCVLNSNLDLLHHVCSFLDGRQVLRCRAVNKFLYLHAPSLVRSLQLDASTASTASVAQLRNCGDGAANGLQTLLLECKNLTSLTISNKNNQTHLKAGVVFPRALTASTYMASLATTSYGHQLVREVACALQIGACPLLEKLEFLAPFDFAAESDGVFLALQALTESATCRKPLAQLVLDATFLGDRGVARLAQLFETQDTHFQHLQTLTLRNNYMGETGCRALLEAVEPFAQLQTLDLSRNILTDTDAFALADLLDTDMSYCANVDGDHKDCNGLAFAGLHTLNLQENFITCDGFHAITIALCSREGFVATVGGAAALNEEEVEVMEVDDA
ncbi:hypothetical protein KRP22_002858 [Phytophthora ramorum]|uniref:uncharacterized protein n=1 Tax=Phytophthora ramorum TaxID=164328 RepID=UPI00309BD121|nr:hypothetical protein KRP23_591 [Phytophthora ramorum]KAH7503454.1 hypothetical protein KRP22_6506 [Phytophthora ramorum]